jgi:hypothetical protein
MAPELAVVDLADACLRALLHAIDLEHPRLDEEPSAHEAPVRYRARALARRARRLRREIAAYRVALDRFIDDLGRDELPF